MNRSRRKKDYPFGPVGTLANFVTARPNNERVTIVDRVVVLISRAAMLLILVSVAITFYEVIMRYLFNSPTSWAYKKAIWLGAIVYLTSGAYAMQRRGHIRITTIYKISPGWLRGLFNYLTLFSIVVYATLMLVGGTEAAIDAWLNWIRSGNLLDPSINGTIKPLVLIMTVVVVIVAINNQLVDNCGFVKSISKNNKDDG